MGEGAAICMYGNVVPIGKNNWGGADLVDLGLETMKHGKCLLFVHDKCLLYWYNKNGVSNMKHQGVAITVGG